MFSRGRLRRAGLPQIAIVATALSVLLGVVLGLTAGYFRGATDTLISRIIDVTLAFPVLLLALGIASSCSLGNGCAGGLIKPGLATVTVAIVVVNWTYIGRIIRGQVLSLREKEFVEAARAPGRGNATILFRELLPNLVAPIVVYSTLVIPQNILLEAALSYLGVGINPPQASWGEMLAEATPIFSHRLVVLRVPRASRSCSPCSPSTCSATGSATPSTRKQPEPHVHSRRRNHVPSTSTRARPSGVAALVAASPRSSHWPPPASSGRPETAAGQPLRPSAAARSRCSPPATSTTSTREPRTTQFTYEITYATQRPLLAYKPSSVKPSPDLAAAMPKVSNGGRTVTVTSARACASARR